MKQLKHGARISEERAGGAQQSPLIMHREWGRLEIEDVGTFKDAKLYPGGAREWNWHETGTRHSPGIQPADVEELLAHGAKVVVLSKGVHEQLQVKDETLRNLQKKGISVHVLQTEAAVERYNDLAREGEAIGALIHSTC